MGCTVSVSAIRVIDNPDMVLLLDYLDKRSKFMAACVLMYTDITDAASLCAFVKTRSDQIAAARAIAPHVADAAKLIAHVDDKIATLLLKGAQDTNSAVTQNFFGR